LNTQQVLLQVEILLNTKRYTDAEEMLREALAAEPNSARAHALLSHALYAQDRNAAALHEAEVAIGLDPEQSSHHYLRARALLALERAGTAMSAIQEALRLKPDDPNYHALVARIHLKRKAWAKAQRAAEQGLQFDPEHVTCLNLRALALTNLGERQDARQTLASALARDPNNALTHANQGWALLHANDHQGALEHFREALRLNPLLDWARSGILEALKARNPIYRLLLRYFLWMSRLTAEEQWETVAIVSAAWRVLRISARAFPPLYIIVAPLSLFYWFFSLLTWTARPLFAMLLRYDREGRLALPREDMIASNWVALCLLTAGGGLIGAMLCANLGFLVLTLCGLAMILPIAGVFRCDPGIGRVVLIVYTVLLALCGLGASVLAIVGSWGLVGASVLGVAFVIGWSSFSLIATVTIWLSRD